MSRDRVNNMTDNVSDIVRKLKGNVLKEVSAHFNMMNNSDPKIRKRYLKTLKGMICLWVVQEAVARKQKLDAFEQLFVVELLVQFVNELGEGSIFRDAKDAYNDDNNK